MMLNMNNYSNNFSWEREWKKKNKNGDIAKGRVRPEDIFILIGDNSTYLYTDGNYGMEEKKSKMHERE